MMGRFITIGLLALVVVAAVVITRAGGDDGGRTYEIEFFYSGKPVETGRFGGTHRPQDHDGLADRRMVLIVKRRARRSPERSAGCSFK